MLKKIVMLFSVCFLLAGCIPFVPFVMLTPEKQLDINSEKISFKIASESSLEEVESWLVNDKPSRAMFSCSSISSYLCDKVSSILDSYEIAYEQSDSEDGDDYILLHYDRVNAKKCDTQEFGCSVSMNTIQHVTDYNQFVKPSISDMQDSRKAISVYDSYLNRKSHHNIPDKLKKSIMDYIH